MPEELQIVSSPSQTSTALPKNATSIPTEKKALSDLTPHVNVKMPKYLVLSGLILALVTVVLIVIGHYTVKYRLGELILIASLALLFVILGLAFQTVYNGIQTKIALEVLKIDGERNTMLHEEAMAKLKLPSAPVVGSIVRSFRMWLNRSV